VAGDLGSWPPTQATVLLEVLKKAGLEPEASRTREGIQVTVPDEQVDDANRILVANMDEIAQAARAPSAGRRRPRTEQPTSRQQRTARASSERPLPTQRLTRLGRPLGLFLVLLMLALLAPVGLRIPLLVFGVGAVIYLIGKQAQRDDGGGSD